MIPPDIEDMKSLWVVRCIDIIEKWLKEKTIFYIIINHEIYGKRIIIKSNDYWFVRDNFLDKPIFKFEEETHDTFTG